MYLAVPGPINNSLTDQERVLGVWFRHPPPSDSDTNQALCTYSVCMYIQSYAMSHLNGPWRPIDVSVSVSAGWFLSVSALLLSTVYCRILIIIIIINLTTLTHDPMRPGVYLTLPRPRGAEVARAVPCRAVPCRYTEGHVSGLNQYLGTYLPTFLPTLPGPQPGH